MSTRWNMNITPAERDAATAHLHERDVHEPHNAPGGHGSHGLMMMICCIPMVLIAVLLVVTGSA
jgi:hypothetical protein